MTRTSGPLACKDFGAGLLVTGRATRAMLTDFPMAVLMSR